MKQRAEIQMEEVAVFIHGVLFSLHAVGVLYNLRKKNKYDALAHALAGAYDLNAVATHLSHLREL